MSNKLQDLSTQEETNVSNSGEASQALKQTPTRTHRPTSPPQTGFSAKWTAAINGLESKITVVLRVITRHAATNPKTYVVGTILLSLGILAAGIFTNFSVDVNDDTLWTPAGSKPVLHMQWIEDTLPADPRPFLVLVHRNGDNVIGEEGLQRVFEAVDSVRNLADYESVCAQSNHTQDVAGKDTVTCNIEGVTSFWNDSTAAFEATVESDADVITALSASRYPNGRPVDLESIVGYPTYQVDGTTVESAQSYLMVLQIPETVEGEAFETDAIDRLLELQDEWDAQGSVFHVEIMAERSFDDEFARAIVNDIPLVPLVFTVMSIFTCAIFFKRDPVHSRSLLGFGAVIAVLLAIMTGYGLLFCIGVPFTSMTQILPFIMFGIGLDDAFIITGEYGRTDPKKDPVERIDETMEAVGLSISLTTITSVLAFGLGAISSIPAVYWLCYYAFPTLAINFLYQITFFVAVIVIDEKRIQDRRRDCCVCMSAPQVDEDNSDAAPTDTSEIQEATADRAMLKFADFLLRPWVKAFVLFAFTGMLAGFSYSASLLEQEFKFTDVLPSDSYITEFFDAFDDLYSRGSVLPQVYFRYVDQSDPEIQAQMETYVNELVGIDAIEQQPTFFWLRDFKKFQANNTDSLATLPFNQQLDLFLENPGYHALYDGDIFRDKDGNIEYSRVMVSMSNIEIDDVRNQIGHIEDQRAVTEAQPINQGQKDWRFFNYADIYNIWEFYSVAVDELILTTIIGVVAVTGVTFLLVPHWTASLFVFPLVSILYIDLLGFLQMAGAHVNAVSYIALVMSIGLLVDFVVHILLRYYECEGNRNEKVRETLRTMGSSIMIGAISTFLGIIPLGFSSSEIFSTIFIAFVGLVVLGALHGLVLLPVVLSLIGPEECIRPRIAVDNDEPDRKAMPLPVVSAVQDIHDVVTEYEV